MAVLAGIGESEQSEATPDVVQGTRGLHFLCVLHRSGALNLFSATSVSGSSRHPSSCRVFRCSVTRDNEWTDIVFLCKQKSQALHDEYFDQAFFSFLLPLRVSIGCFVCLFDDHGSDFLFLCPTSAS